MSAVLLKVKDFLKKVYTNKYIKSFCLIYLFGLVAFGIVAAKNHFTIPMGGDYVLQTYAFYSQGYTVFWDFIKTGEYPLFDFSNYLGANYLGTQSFYYVFSPLFYLLCLWPRKFLYQGIFFHMVFKFALGGFFMYVLLKKYFSVSEKMSVLGGLIYAFSGWSLFYLWFHFGDIVAFFPLFIMGIEKCLKERKGWLLSIGTFLCGISNYFFLVNFIIFGVLYALYRWIYIYGINKKRGYSAKVRYSVLLQGILYAAIGVMMSAICLLPSLHVAMSTNRNQTSTSYLISLLSIFFEQPAKVDGKLVLGNMLAFKDIVCADNLKQLLKVLFVWEERTVSSSTIVSGKQSVGYILSNWIFMNTNCWDNILFDNVSLDNSIGGFFITTPLTMLLVPSVVAAFKTKRPWTIFGVIICLALPFFPITAHMAFAFTSLYGRWQIWIVMIGIIFIIQTLDKFENVNRKWVTVNLVLNLALAFIVYKISKDAQKLPTNSVINFLGKEMSLMLVVAIVEVCVMVLVWAIYRFKLFKPVVIRNIMVIIVVVEIGASAVITTKQKGYFKWDEYYLSQPEYQELNEVIDYLKDTDDDFYRIMNTEATRSTMNMPSALNYAGASSFNSTYSFNLDVFKNRSRMAYGGGWTMGNHEKRYWLDQYLGTKYYIVDKHDLNNDNRDYHKDDSEFFDGRETADSEKQTYNLNLPWTYEKYKSFDYYDIYLNTNFTGIGYSVDNYVLHSKMSYKGTNSHRYNATYYEELYSSMAIIYDEDAETLNKELGRDIQEGIYYQESHKFSYSKWDYYFSPREDACVKINDQVDAVRPVYKLENDGITKAEISQYLKPTSQFLHTRWEEKKYFGDKFILKLKDGSTPLCYKASTDNKAYLALTFKLGPKVLISLYNGDKLVTQDAHMNSNSSLNDYGSEWKTQRGFYVDQPIDKIVIECVSDASFAKMFDKSGNMAKMDIYYLYEDEINEKQELVNNKIIENVDYNNNKFTFTTNNEQKELVVTNIPFDKGWTLKANGKEKKIYDVNGGFIGFVSEKGETNYELKYFTPLLKEGFMVALFGLLMFIALNYIYRNSKVPILAIQYQIDESFRKQQLEKEKKDLEQLEAFKTKIKSFFKRK